MKKILIAAPEEVPEALASDPEVVVIPPENIDEECLGMLDAASGGLVLGGEGALTDWADEEEAEHGMEGDEEEPESGAEGDDEEEPESGAEGDDEEEKEEKKSGSGRNGRGRGGRGDEEDEPKGGYGRGGRGGKGSPLSTWARSFGMRRLGWPYTGGIRVGWAPVASTV